MKAKNPGDGLLRPCCVPPLSSPITLALYTRFRAFESGRPPIRVHPPGLPLSGSSSTSLSGPLETTRGSFTGSRPEGWSSGRSREPSLTRPPTLSQLSSALKLTYPIPPTLSSHLPCSNSRRSDLSPPSTLTLCLDGLTSSSHNAFSHPTPF